jgi:hypothetical protein
MSTCVICAYRCSHSYTSPHVLPHCCSILSGISFVAASSSTTYHRHSCSLRPSVITIIASSLRSSTPVYVPLCALLITVIASSLPWRACRNYHDLVKPCSSGTLEGPHGQIILNRYTQP